MSVDSQGLGELLQRLYSAPDITKVLKAALPVFHALRNRAEVVEMCPEWSVVRELTWHPSGLAHYIVKYMHHKYMHHCPTGDVRVISGKTCHLCKVEVPGWVELMVRCLEDEE